MTMKLILRLAWRSLTRHRRRTVITLAAVSLSLGLMIIFVGLGDDGHERMAKIGIRLGAGYVLVQGKGYQKTQTLDHLVHDPRRVIEVARASQGLLASLPVLDLAVKEPPVEEIIRKAFAGEGAAERRAVRGGNDPGDGVGAGDAAPGG